MNAYLIAILVILALLFVVFCVASFIRWYARRITIWFNLKKLEINKPIEEYTLLLLEENGLVDVEVKKVGFFASLFIGNTYKKKTKTIRLAWGTARRTTVTNLASACKLVGLAKLHSEGVKGLGAVAFNRYFNWLPILFLPLVVIGIIIDLISNSSVGVLSLIFALVGFAFTIFPFIISLIALRIEKKALKYGQEIIIGMGILNETEEKKIKKLFSAWKNLYVINTLFNALEMLYFVLKIIFSSVKLFGRK